MLGPILICGNDPTLLLTRKLVLEHAGFRVKAVLGLSRLMEDPGERVLLCSSLGQSDQLKAIKWTRANRPGAKILVVASEEGDCDETVLKMSAYSNAEALIENARLLTQ